MLTIFNGRQRSLDGANDTVYAQLSVDLRDHLHVFRNGNDLNSFAVFMAIALHSNADGWSFPPTFLLQKETGLTTAAAISRSIIHLRDIRINGKPILAHYRIKKKGKWGKSYYHIFPESGGEDKPPKIKEGEVLERWHPVYKQNPEKPPHAVPTMVIPVMVQPIDSLSITNLNDNQSKENTITPQSDVPVVAPEVKRKTRTKASVPPSETVATVEKIPSKLKTPEQKALYGNKEIRKAIAHLCYKDLWQTAWTTDSTSLGKALRLIILSDPNLSIEKMRRFYKWYYTPKNEWQRLNPKSAPSIYGVHELWLKFMQSEIELEDKANQYVADPRYPNAAIMIRKSDYEWALAEAKREEEHRKLVEKEHQEEADRLAKEKAAEEEYQRNLPEDWIPY